MQRAPEELVRALGRANAAFYDAFRTGNLAAMEVVWSAADDIVCLHPGVAPIMGREAVMRSWASILTGPAEVAFQPRHAAFIGAEGGLVSGIEVLSEARLAATNLFRLENGAWRMICHQAGGIRTTTDRPPDTVLH